MTEKFSHISNEGLEKMHQDIGAKIQDLRSDRSVLISEINRRRGLKATEEILSEAQRRIDAVLPGAVIVVNARAEGGPVEE